MRKLEALLWLQLAILLAVLASQIWLFVKMSELARQTASVGQQATLTSQQIDQLLGRAR
jgi:hypothetical protein